MKTITKALAVGILTILFAACGSEKQDQTTASEAATYKVATLKTQDIVLFSEYPTTIEGKQTVEIRPRVSGYIDQINVEEGQQVHKGQTLFSLNADDLKAQVNAAQAQVRVAKSQVETAQLNVERIEPLVEKDIVSAFELKTAESSLASAESSLANAKSALASAQANLDYAIIKSPADGIVGYIPYHEGALVSSNIAKPLTTVSDTREIDAYFSINEKEYFSLLSKLEGKTKLEKLRQLKPIRLVLANGSTYEKDGELRSASGVVDKITGSVQIRAVFDNPYDILSSGLSGKVCLPEQYKDAILVPQSAVSVVQNQHFVYVVGANKQVVNTPVEVEAGSLKNFYVVTKGLNAGDQLVLEGVSKLKDGVTINPQEVQLDSTID
ncbi:MAG: efflux RND transporter periplasmic adaptor subunit [Mangrovibacterium sp.]